MPDLTTCKGCGNDFQNKSTGRGRRFDYCETCRGHRKTTAAPNIHFTNHTITDDYDPRTHGLNSTTRAAIRFLIQPAARRRANREERLERSVKATQNKKAMYG